MEILQTVKPQCFTGCRCEVPQHEASASSQRSPSPQDEDHDLYVFYLLFPVKQESLILLLIWVLKQKKKDFSP